MAIRDMLRIEIPVSLPSLLAVVAMIWMVIGRQAKQSSDDSDEDAPFGATEEKLRLWLAEEAVRQGELQLASQAASFQAYETRGTASLGWIVTLGVAITAVVFNTTHKEWQIPALAIGLILSFAALMTIIGVWPYRRRASGFDPQQILDMQYGTEVEARESLALGMEAAIQENRRKLLRTRRCLQTAWICFALSPAAGLTILFFR